MKNPEEIEAELRQKKIELRERVDAIRRDAGGGLDPDLETHAAQADDAAALDVLLKQALSELEEIEQKLRSQD